MALGIPVLNLIHIHQAKIHSVPVLLVNARLSDKSLKRHQSVHNLARSYFGSLSGILAGSESDRKRFESLGWIPAERIHSTGNLKFDVELEVRTDAEARFALGSHYRWGRTPVSQDFVSAYLWHISAFR